MPLVLTGMLLMVVWAAVPLTEAQRTQLDSAVDFSGRFDEAALYPLLHNAWQWQEGDETGAAVPDYTAILKSPAEHRGDLVLIEGLFAGVPRGRSLKLASLSRPGPWDDRIQWWGIVVDQARDDVVVVFLVDPPPAPPAPGARVRLVGRFYKVLADTDLHGRPTNYLAFVGRGATVQRRAVGGGSTRGAVVLFGALAILAGAWFVLRRTLRARPLRLQQRRETRPVTEPGAPGDQVEGIDLPKDPAEALGVLGELHE